MDDTRSHKEAPVYNADRRFQPQALYALTQQARTSSAAITTPRPRQLLRTILEALSWLGEMRAMPFAGLGTGSQHGDRSRQDY